MKGKAVVFLLFASLGLGLSANAQTTSKGRVGATVVWTTGGAGAGFGIGLWAGLRAFDDAINSDRKVWTTAIVGAAVGALGGYLIGRTRGPKSQPSSPTARFDAQRPFEVQLCLRDCQPGF